MAIGDAPSDPTLSNSLYGDLPPAPWESADYWTDPVAADAVPDALAAPLPDPVGADQGPPPEPVTESVDIGPSAPTAPYDATGAPIAGPGPDPGINPPLFETGLIDNPYAAPPLADAEPAPPIPYGTEPAPNLLPPPGDAPGGVPGEIAPAPFGPQLPSPVPVQPGPPTLDVTAKDPFGGLSPAEGYAAARNLASTDGAAFDQLKQNREAERRIAESAARVRAEDENLRNLQNNLDARRIADEKTQKQQDAITKDALELSKRPLDRRRYFKNQSVIGNIFAAIATVAGGLASRPGGPNMGLDYLNKLIDDDINDQKADMEDEKSGIQARQGAVAQEFARTGNLYQAAETVRQATYQSVIAKLQAEQQNYDPRGQGYIDHGNYIQGVKARAAESAEKNRKEMFKENLDTAKSDLEKAQFEEQKRKNRAEQALAWKRENRETATAKKAEQAYEPAQLRILNPDSPVPPVAMTLPQFKQWQDIQKGGQDLKAAQRDNDPDTLARARQVPGLTTQSNKPLLFQPEEVKELKTAQYTARELVRKSDELRALVKEHGYSNNWLKSDYYQEAQQIFNDMLLMDKDLKSLGALSASDVKLVTANLGTDDPTQLRDTMKGMESYRRSVVEGLNSKISSTAVLPEGEQVKRWEPVDTSKLPKATKTPEQERLETILAKPEQTYDELVREEMYKEQSRLDLSPAQLRDPYYRDKTLQAGIKAASERYDSDVSSKQQDALLQLQTEALGKVGDPKADRARQDLTTIMRDGDTADLRALARRALDSAAIQEGLSSGESPVTEPQRSTARETVPPPRSK